MNRIPVGGATNEYLSGLDLQEIYGGTMTKEKPPVLGNEKAYARDIIDSYGMFANPKKLDECAEEIAEIIKQAGYVQLADIFQWGNEPCPHQFYANTKQQCRACWDNLRDEIKQTSEG